MVNDSYGYNRLSGAEVRGRLAMGDDPHPNRVLHVASRGGTIVGCCSSTLQVPWCDDGCGHWGLLTVAEEARGEGVGTALVAAAEARLRAAGLDAVQMEYEFEVGSAASERLCNGGAARPAIAAARVSTRVRLVARALSRTRAVPCGPSQLVCSVDLSPRARCHSAMV